MNSCLVYILVTLVLASTVLFRCANSNSCTKDSCFPPAWGLETVRGASITANSTCGLSENEEFCIKQQCGYHCNNAVPSNYHGPNLTIDTVNDDTYWKSKNLDENVVLEIELGHSYFFYEVTATFAFSYPAAMYFSKSDNHGATWETLAYFSSDCDYNFNMSAVEENDRNGFIVECFRLDSADIDLKASYQPWRDQQFAENIHQNYTLQKKFLATNFKMVLVKFETPPNFDAARADERNFYFAVKDWYIRGSCYCHGQSAQCNAEENWKCDCLKNTTGDNCQECLPLFNNEKYEPGKICAACECNNHSARCEYDDIKGYGVCQNCTGFSTGDACDQCLPYYYEAPFPIDHPDRCQACNCDTSGITGEPGSDMCGRTEGLCACKDNVTSRTCGECKDGYWNLTKANPYGCQECNCERAGTGGSNVCDKITGQCPCRENLVGLRCTECEDGYFGLTYENPSPCKDCSCSLDGSLNKTCDQATGSCYCREKFSGPNCTSLEPGYYVPGVPELTYEAEQAKPSAVYHNATTGITGVLIDGSSGSRSLVFNIDTPKTSVYTLVVRYQTAVDWNDVTLNVESMVAPFSPYSCNGNAPITNQSFVLTATASSSSTALSFGDRCLVKGHYKITLEFPFVTTRVLSGFEDGKALIDSLVVLPSVKNISYPVADNATLFYYEKAFSFDTWSKNKDKIQTFLAPYYSFLYDGGKACSCNDTGSHNRSSCDKNGGQCICKPNVDGINCDRCKAGFFNFSDAGCQECRCDNIGSNSTLCDLRTGECPCKEGVVEEKCTRCEDNYFGFNSGTGCLPCLCNPQYSRNLQCDSNGICPCLPGVKPTKCHECNDTSFNLTLQGCDACNCDIHGTLESANLACNKQTGKCRCKTLVVGQKCDSCVTGYFYGLDKYHPTGCLKCQCSGKTVNCSSKINMYETKIVTDLDPGNNDLGGWNSTGGINFASIFAFIDGGLPRGIIVVTSNTDQVIYFKAPAKFLGDKRRAYQHRLSFYLREKDTGDSLDTDQGDVILKGKWFSENLVHKFNKVPGDEFSEFSVLLAEEDWKVGDTNGRNVSSYEMVMVLSELEELWIRAKWSNGTAATTGMGKISMYISKEYLNSSQIPSGARMTQSVELCDCPREFTGDSCEQCAEGYTRLVPNSGPYSNNSTCVLCDCHGNSDRCDPDTGVCIDCKHNTTGGHCERCATGYYGNATLGSAYPCKLCSCFGGHTSCELVSDGSFLCNCGDGYEGDRCEACALGFYGVPTEGNGRCSRCDCNGNSQICNRTSGDCSSFCQNNSTGSNCEFCKPEFFGDATIQTCAECNCVTNGSYNNTCDRTSGQCHCRPNVDGRNCSNCKENFWGHGNITGCEACGCDNDGSTSLQCDLKTGICDCKTDQNVTGIKCDRCIDGRYGVALGCKECECNMTYSNHSICDPRNGQCQCLQSSAGGFYGGRQCTQCRWDAVGTFPSCAQCNETCYENWYLLIAKERDKVNKLSRNVTNVLKTFNGTSVENINETLVELNTKLNESERIFNGAHDNTEAKMLQYNKINSSLSELKQDLDKAENDLQEVLNYVANVSAPFDGTVTVSSAAPPVEANYTTIRDWAERILQRVEENNRTAYENYENVTNHYDQIKDYNSSGAGVVEEVKRSVRRLVDIEKNINETNSILNQEFYGNVEKNGETLTQLSKDSEEISRLVNESSLISRAATEMLDHAQGNISEARHKAENNLNESRSVYDESIETHRKAYEAGNVSAQFKANSSDLLTQVENAISEVKRTIDEMAQARANLGNATEIAEEVLGMTIPVKEQRIADLSQRILAIEVNEALVNDTLKNATAGLRIAEEARQLAERAKNVSETTLKQVNEIETKITEARERREEARRLQNATDQMVSEIMQITDVVENEYSEAQKVGNDTLVLLNRTINDIDNSLKCFNDSKELAMEANRVAKLAYKQILNASKKHNESETRLRDIETQLNSSYNIAMTSYHSIVATYQNASRLFEEVKEAEDLLKTYIRQRDEMDTLKTEVTQLESQLDTLNNDLDRKLQEYEACNGGG